MVIDEGFGVFLCCLLAHLEAGKLRLQSRFLFCHQARLEFCIRLVGIELVIRLLDRLGGSLGNDAPHLPQPRVGPVGCGSDIVDPLHPDLTEVGYPFLGGLPGSGEVTAYDLGDHLNQGDRGDGELLPEGLPDFPKGCNSQGGIVDERQDTLERASENKERSRGNILEPLPEVDEGRHQGIADLDLEGLVDEPHVLHLGSVLHELLDTLWSDLEAEIMQLLAPFGDRLLAEKKDPHVLFPAAPEKGGRRGVPVGTGLETVQVGDGVLGDGAHRKQLAVNILDLDAKILESLLFSGDGAGELHTHPFYHVLLHAQRVQGDLVGACLLGGGAEDPGELQGVACPLLRLGNERLEDSSAGEDCRHGADDADHLVDGSAQLGKVTGNDTRLGLNRVLGLGHGGDDPSGIAIYVDAYYSVRHVTLPLSVSSAGPGTSRCSSPGPRSRAPSGSAGTGRQWRIPVQVDGECRHPCRCRGSPVGSGPRSQP